MSAMCISSAIKESPTSRGLRLPLFFSPSQSPLCIFLWFILTSPVLCCLPLVDSFKLHQALWRVEQLWSSEPKDNTAKWRKLRSNSLKAGFISSNTVNPLKHCQEFNWIISYFTVGILYPITWLLLYVIFVESFLTIQRWLVCWFRNL